jgi:hypothetical protein
VSAAAALTRYREEAGADPFAPVSAECARMLADALTVSPAAAASRARALARAHALLAESNQPLTMSSDQLYRLLARYQRSLLDLVLLLEDDSPGHPAA